MNWDLDGQIQNVNQEGVYTLATWEEDPELALALGAQSLKIAKPDTGEYYYLAYRRIIGDFNAIPYYLRDQLSIYRYKGDGSSNKTYGSMKNTVGN
mgnify:CR=1 FL=1